MNVYEMFGMLAQANTEGSPVLGMLILSGVMIWLLAVVFGKKKDKYIVSRHTSVRKVK